MGKGELCKAIKEQFGLTGEASEAIVGAVLDEIAAAVKGGDTVTIRGFGTFKPKVSPARTVRNPQTGKPMKVPAKKSMVFKCSKDQIAASSK